MLNNLQNLYNGIRCNSTRPGVTEPIKPQMAQRDNSLGGPRGSNALQKHYSRYIGATGNNENVNIQNQPGSHRARFEEAQRDIKSQESERQHMSHPFKDSAHYALAAKESTMQTRPSITSQSNAMQTSQI